MPKQVCRISWKKGRPLSLARYPSATFLDLPREIRDQIYHDVLVSLDPVTVWSGHYDRDYDEKDGRLVMTETITVDATDPILEQLTLGLLSCSRQIAPEAAATFYRFNTFQFRGHDTWQPLCGFLRMIGKHNRAHLRSLIAEAGEPENLTQDRDGIRYWQFDFVDHLSPAVEACFRILGKIGPGLTLRLALKRGLLPGARVWPDDEQADDAFGWESLALPDLVERSRRSFTAERVVVLWEGVGLRDMFREQQGVIESQGWEIVDASEGEIRRDHSLWPPIPTMLFTLRRK